ncbi:hypothetical protein B0H21DRAFT_788628 [Amylocystis lapponica]|nr:hypothetical protein B0H21DRAFT_788628 [Amylocystis lapponica]
MATSTRQNLLSSDVQDPSDFPPQPLAPGLRQLDDALRCSICREFYEAPVMLTCGHCYCSLCIRSVLPDKPECPSCRQNASEIHLRKNPALEDAVKAWGSAREFVLRLSKDEAARRTSSPRPVVQADAPHMARKRKRGRSASDSSGDQVQVVGRPSKHFTSISQVKGMPEAHHEPNTQPGNIHTSHGQDRDIVLCPVCQQQVHHDMINQHLDSKCQSETFTLSSHGGPAASKGRQKEQWSRLLNGGAPSSPSRKGKQRERARSESADSDPGYLPKVNYDVLSAKMLQERLAEHGLPTTGHPAARTRRHAKWVMMWNANVDHAPAQRKTAEQLRRDLKKWEDEQKTKKQTVADTVAYQKANKAEFQHLIEAARPRKSRDNPQEQGVSDTSTARSPDGDDAFNRA